MFDNDEKKIGTVVNGKPILNIDNLKEYVKENQISIAILALPKTEVSDIVSILSECGIKGLWNFSSAEINVGNEIAVENVHMSDSLMTLSYKIKQEEK